MTITVTTQENVLKNVFVERFAIPLDFDFFKHPIYPYRFKEDLILKLESNSSENECSNIQAFKHFFRI